MFDQLCVVEEFSVQTVAGLSLCLLLLKLVHIVELRATTCEVDIFSRDA